MNTNSGILWILWEPIFFDFLLTVQFLVVFLKVSSLQQLVVGNFYAKTVKLSVGITIFASSVETYILDVKFK